MTAFYKMTGLCRLFPNNNRLAHYYMGGIPWNDARQIEVVSGAFCLLRREALLQVGLLDEDYFMYGEDIELSYQLLHNGWQNWYLPLYILHYKGESTAKTSFRYVHVFYKAMLIFIRKHYSAASLIGMPLKFAIFFKALAAMFHQLISMILRAFNLSSKHQKDDSCYIFIGCEAMLDACRKLAINNGLKARFIEGNQTSMPSVSLEEACQRFYLVYDMEVFSYAYVLKDMVLRADERCSLGTYRRKTLITAEEIIYEGG